MDEKLKCAYNAFYGGDYASARAVFAMCALTYEAGVCSLLIKDLISARSFFAAKAQICPASAFGLIILDIIEDKTPPPPKYFQVRSFLEIFINLLIENHLLDWAQKIINSWEYFTRANIEVPKFIARVLNANNYNKTVHSFANLAKDICFNDAEIHYIDASLYIKEGNINTAQKCINDCISFAPEYYPILQLKTKCR